MSFLNYIHLFFLIILLLSAFFLVILKNPVHSVLLLILCFFCSASIVILFSVDFIGILFLIIYVGAIAVLFLFVVMMLDLKITPLKTEKFFFFFFFSSLFFFFFVFTSSLFFFFCFYELDFGSLFQKKFVVNSYFFNILDFFSNIDVFGQCLYNYFLICFLIAGIILLLAMLGAIALTLKYNSNVKNQLVYKQLSRTSNFLTFFK